MKIAVVSAMEKELRPIINKLQGLEEKTYLNYKFYLGKMNGNDLIFTTGGIGKTNTGIITAIVNNLFPGIDFIINMGISGGVKGNINKGDIVISRFLAYADVDVTVLGYRFGQIPDLPEIFTASGRFNNLLTFGKVGDILSGDSFFTNENDVKNLLSKFEELNVCALDMESTAFAQCCYQYNIPFLAIRAISDVIGEENQKEEYENYNKIACEKACNALEAIINAI